MTSSATSSSGSRRSSRPAPASCLPRGPSVDDDPVTAWRVHADAVQALLDDPGTPSKVLTNPHIGEVPLDRAVDQFYTSDVFMHTWDLARATGQDETLDPTKCGELLAGMEPIDDLLRQSGQYGAEGRRPAGLRRTDADARLHRPQPALTLVGFMSAGL